MNASTPGTTGMTSQPPSHLPEPPPSGRDLVHADRVVGWIEAGAIGFVGFATAAEAARAAWAAHRVIAQRLSLRGHDAQVLPLEPGSLVVGPERDAEAILADGERIATLVRPGAESRSGPDAFGFALPVPSPGDTLALRSTAYLVFRALRAAGVVWAMWTPEPREGADGAPTDAGARSRARSRTARRALVPRPTVLRATPFRLATAGVLGGATLIALLEWLVFGTPMAVGLLGVVLVLVPIAVLVDRRRGGAAAVHNVQLRKENLG